MLDVTTVCVSTLSDTAGTDVYFMVLGCTVVSACVNIDIASLKRRD